MQNVILLNKGINEIDGEIITSFLISNFPKTLVAEFNTHSLISRNWESSRARPTSSVIEQVMNNPYIFEFTKNQTGMSGGNLSDTEKERARTLALDGRSAAIRLAKNLYDCGVHKQEANRYLEPWMRVSGVVTATHWENFYDLRCSEQAQPGIREYALQMRRLDRMTSPVIIPGGEWFLPYPELSLKANVAKIASVSYARHAVDRTAEASEALYNRLWGQRHLSPFQHVAMAAETGSFYENCQYFNHFQPDKASFNFHSHAPVISTGNYSGFIQLRKMLEAGITINAITRGTHDG